MPNRIADAEKTSASPESIAPPASAPSVAPLPPPAPVLSPLPADCNPALDLLKQAYAELVSRKESIEAQLARVSHLTKELETVNSQIQALDKTLGVFEPSREP